MKFIPVVALCFILFNVLDLCSGSEGDVDGQITDAGRHRRNGPPARYRVPQPRPFLRPAPIRPLPPRPYPVRPGTTIPYLPFFRVMPVPVPAPQVVPTSTAVNGTDEKKSVSKKLQVKSGLDNKSEAEVEIMPVTLVVDMDVLATGVLDLLNTMDETGLLSDSDETLALRTALEAAKEGERSVFEVDPSSMNIILSEIMKSHMKNQ